MQRLILDYITYTEKVHGITENEHLNTYRLIVNCVLMIRIYPFVFKVNYSYQTLQCMAANIGNVARRNTGLIIELILFKMLVTLFWTVAHE